jgi:hypothetical protein
VKILAFMVSLILAIPFLALAQTTPTPVNLSSGYHYDFTFGSSVPATDAKYLFNKSTSTIWEKADPVSRITGGSIIKIRFGNHQAYSLPFTGVRLIAYSSSGKGSVLIHNVTATPSLAAATFNPLIDFASILSDGLSKAQNYNNLVMLQNEDSVEVGLPSAPNESELDVQAEAFGDDDASLVVQIFSSTLINANVGTDENIQLANPPISSGGGGGGSDGPPALQCKDPGIYCTQNSDCCSGYCGSNIGNFCE